MAKKNDPKCKECFDEGCKACLDDMPDCLVCQTNKFVDTVEPDQGIFCCIKCGSQFVEHNDDEGDDSDLLQRHWDRLSGIDTKVSTDKPEFGKVVDDTDPSNPREI